MVVARNWVVPEPDRELLRRLARGASCPEIVASLLLNRGVREPGEALRFLEPKLLDLGDPFDLPDMERAVARVELALRREERIAVFGDYDADGVSSTCLLLDFFRTLGKAVHFRLPHRLREGYGLRVETVRELAGEGVDLLVTVDNGSSSRAEVALARELGMDVIVVDHHQPAAEPPEPVALVNPWLDRTGRADRHLAGVGVTFKLVWGLCQRVSRARKISAEFRQFLLDSLALVALGTISDVVPLRGENRVLAKYGLLALESSRRPGIRRMVASVLRGGGARAGLEARHVGFRLGPRINAAGRLGEADLAIRLLRTESDEEAAHLVDLLERENRRRREIEEAIYRDARARVLGDLDLSRERAVVLADRQWHAGVIGIVAARLVEEFCRPTLLVALDGARGRGSARSVRGVHICDALERCKVHLEAFGGHALAAGVEVRAEQIPALRRALNEAVDLSPEEMVPAVEADCRVSLSELTGELLERLARLEPHGEGNPEPLFASGELEVVGRPRRLGAGGEHLAFFVREERRAFRAIAFGRGELWERLSREGARVALLFQPRWNEWAGRREIELNVRDLRVVGRE